MSAVGVFTLMSLAGHAIAAPPPGASSSVIRKQSAGHGYGRSQRAYRSYRSYRTAGRSRYHFGRHAVAAKMPVNPVAKVAFVVNAAKPPVQVAIAKPAGKPAMKPASLAVPALTSVAAPAPPDTEKRISLDFVAADINDVLKALALQADINIVTAADVKGNITVSLNRVTVPEALDMIARLSGFQYARVGPAYVVGTAKSVTELSGNANAPVPVEPVTEFIPYRFVLTNDLLGALGNRFSDVKAVAGDGKDEKLDPSRPRLLTLSGAPERVAGARSFIQDMDTAATFPTTGAVTEVYRVKYAAPADLVSVLLRLVPTVQALLGPSQGFQSGSTGATASFSSSSSGGASGANDGASSASGGVPGGAGTANPSSAVASGSAPTALLLTGNAADIARARQVLDQVDIRVPQLYFEAKVVDLNNTDLQRLGLKYDFSRGVSIGEADGGISPAIDQVGARRPNFGAILRTPYSIGVSLEALAQNNKARILASPNLSALDGQPAVAFIGDQVKYVISIQQTPQGQNITTETATVGITLKVTGKSSPDGNITLYVHPEVSVIQSFLNLGNGISLPQIASRFVDTTIRVKDGETIAIGGLIREQDITNIQKVPFLGDLPILGQLFRHTDKSRSKSELMVFITSKVLND